MDHTNLRLRLCINGTFLDTYDLFEDRYTVGRSGSILIPQLSLGDEEYSSISRVHCTLLAVHPTYLLIDGNNRGVHSRNGISINGRRCRASMLRENDLIALSRKVYFEILSDEPVIFGTEDDTRGADENEGSTRVEA